MAFTIPSSDEAAAPAVQSQIFETDISILVAALSGTGVVSGCGVTAQGSPDMTVAVAAGVILAAGVPVAVSSGNLTVGAADATNPRVDLISASAAGDKTITAGTAAAAASVKPPDLPSGHIGLAFVYVAANDTAIGSTEIVDKKAVLRADTLTLTEAVLGGNVTITTAGTFYDGPTITPAAGTYEVWARVTFFTGGTGNRGFTARLIANASATPIDEAEIDAPSASGNQYSVYLAARVVADGTNPILVRGTSSTSTVDRIDRNPQTASSGIHRQTLLRITRVA